MDRTTKFQRSDLMGRVKSKGSRRETLLQKRLWHWGIKYRKNVRSLFGVLDIAIKKR
jgi:DNA mismatch endonuclease (patch repair protein)